MNNDLFDVAELKRQDKENKPVRFEDKEREPEFTGFDNAFR